MAASWDRRWSYSDYVDQLAAELKATKKLEEANGTAKPEAITSHIAVTLPREARNTPNAD